MKQTNRASLVESISNVVTGYVIGIAVQIVAYPMFGIKVSIWQDSAIGAIFLATSMARSFVLRRTFESLRVRGWLP